MKNGYFIIVIVVVLLLAKLAPSIGAPGGILKPEYTVKYGAVFLVLLYSGLRQRTELLAESILKWDVHLMTQLFTYVAFPAIVGILVMLLRFSFLQPELLDGITILGTMPTPISSGIILTQAAGGNEGTAVFNSILGSMMGVVVTPMLISTLLGGQDGNVHTDVVFKQLFLTVVIPLIIGQMIRNYKYQWLQRQRIPFQTIGQVLILIIIYTEYCDYLSRTDFDLPMTEFVSTIILTIFLLIIMKVISLICTYYVYQFPAEDAISIMYTASNKNLQLGVPMIEAMFEGSADVGNLSIPHLIYNPYQMLIGALSIGVVKSWLETRKTVRRGSSSYTPRY